MSYNLGDSTSLDAKAKDLDRARQSLIEELQAIDWYEERIQASSDSDLKKILIHNRDEEKEHAAMITQWVKKNDPVFDDAFNQHD